MAQPVPLAPGRDPLAAPPLFDLAYDELYRLAQHQLRRERRNHTLTPTALVHEAYLKLAPQAQAAFESRRHFLCIAAQAMRRILVNHARDRRAQKRGGGVERVTLKLHHARTTDDEVDVLALDRALDDLERLDPQKRQLVELRYFAGLTGEETAEALGLSRATFYREWATARAWLYRRLHDTL